MKYIKGKGILVGKYDADDIAKGTDKKDTKEMQEKTGYKYTNTEFIKTNGKIVGLKIYVCKANDFKL